MAIIIIIIFFFIHSLLIYSVIFIIQENRSWLTYYTYNTTSSFSLLLWKMLLFYISWAIENMRGFIFFYKHIEIQGGYRSRDEGIPFYLTQLFSIGKRVVVCVSSYIIILTRFYKYWKYMNMSQIIQCSFWSGSSFTFVTIVTLKCVIGALWVVLWLRPNYSNQQHGLIRSKKKGQIKSDKKKQPKKFLFFLLCKNGVTDIWGNE